jgi:two-component system OmpR family sensor kinase
MSDATRVLLVSGGDDGDPAAARLRSAGFDVVRASGLDDALAAFGEDGVDCVVHSHGDDGQPVAGDAELLEAARGAHPGVPFVVFSDAGSEGVAGAVLAAEGTAVVRRDGEGRHDRLLATVAESVGSRRATAEAERRARRSDVVLDINQALVRADTRKEIEQSVAERLAESEDYLLSWIAEVDDGAVSLRAMGVDGGAIKAGGAIDISEETAYTEPVLRAAEARAPVVAEDPAVGAWEAALSSQPESVAAIPFVYEDRVYGVLVLYADRPDAFDWEERRVLAEVGENVAYAMNAVAVRRKFQLRERALRRQNEHLEEFAEVVSHDLRNPLTVARGSIDLLEEEGAHVDRITDSLKRMESLVDDVLELARQGRTVGETQPVDVADAARAAWGNVDTGQVTLEAETRRLEADQSRLVQLLENLFRNAVEHASPHFVRVGPTDGGFYVEDDGPGLPEEQRDDLFQSGVTTADDGTGFGLAIVRSIAEAHGWSVAATEGTDGGARFAFSGVTEPGGDETAGPAFGDSSPSDDATEGDGVEAEDGTDDATDRDEIAED